MSLFNYGDPEVKANELGSLDSVLDDLGKKLDKAQFEHYNVPVLGWLYRKIMGPDVVVLPGDLIDQGVQMKAILETQNLYNTIVNYDDLVNYDSLRGPDQGALKGLKRFFDRLDDSLKTKLKHYKKKFKVIGEDHMNENFSMVYADLLFDKDLKATRNSVAGAYTKIFKKLQEFAKKRKVEFAFVLGNHDLDFHLFKDRYDKLKGLDNIHFIDRKVEKVGKYRLGGFGGSPEDPEILKKFGINPFCTYQNGDLEEAKNKFLSEFSGSLDALVVHKAHNDVVPDEVLWGEKLGKYVVFNGAFIPAINNIIEHFNPKNILFGHFHKAFAFVKDGVNYLNPGKRQASKTSFWGKPALVA